MFIKKEVAPVTNLCQQCYSERLRKYAGIFIQPACVNFQVCAKVHEEDESP